jgi:acyl-homoserine-lactone acylase
MRQRIHHYSLKLVFTLLIFSSTVIAAFEVSAGASEILWDNYGVPHIYGKNAREMYYSFGWAQMSCHADLILRLYAEARGRAAEFFGSEYIESDKKILCFDLPALARSGYLSMGKEYRSYLDAFVKGMNDYSDKHPELIDNLLRPVLPVTPDDVIAHTIRVINLEFLAGEDLSSITGIAAPGSNSIAIGPKKSATGNAMLLANPHLPWNGFFTWFEAHLNSKGFNAYGVALVGMPTLSIAFNDYLGWTHTVNTIDASDRFELTLKDAGYILDNKVLSFKIRHITLKVKQADGSMGESDIVLKSSEHGPVLGEKGNKAWAVRIAGLENFGIHEQYHRMAGAKNLSEFQEALKMLQNPMFNVIYADRAGNILYFFNGNVPIRPSGDFAFWRGTIDGTRSDYIWKNYHGYAELPQVLNPQTGFVQNCNDAPWTCTCPQVLDPSDFPPYMSSHWMGWRPQRAINMIKDNNSVTFSQLVDYKLNTGMEVADRFLDDLLKAVEKYPDSLTLQAAGVLIKWDRKTDCKSRGAILFAQWWDQVNTSMFEVKWDPANPASTPDGLNNYEEAVKLLSKAASVVLSNYGSLDIAWGDVNRLRINELDYPANGGPDKYGIFRTLYFVPDKDNKTHPVAGETYFAVTEFGKKVRAKVMLSYGNATQKGNKHIGDQLKLMSEKKLRPALLTRSEIISNLEKKEILKFE